MTERPAWQRVFFALGDLRVSIRALSSFPLLVSPLLSLRRHLPVSLRRGRSSRIVFPPSSTPSTIANYLPSYAASTTTSGNNNTHAPMKLSSVIGIKFLSKYSKFVTIVRVHFLERFFCLVSAWKNNNLYCSSTRINIH